MVNVFHRTLNISTKHTHATCLQAPRIRQKEQTDLQFVRDHKLHFSADYEMSTGPVESLDSISHLSHHFTSNGGAQKVFLEQMWSKMLHVSVPFEFSPGNQMHEKEAVSEAL